MNDKNIEKSIKKHDILNNILGLIGSLLVICTGAIFIVICTTNNVYHICINKAPNISNQQLHEYQISVNDNYCKKCSNKITENDIVILKNNYCKNCHTDNLQGDFCKKCGNEILKQYGESIKNTQYKTVARFKKQFKTLTIIDIICAISGVLFFIIQNSHKSYYSKKYNITINDDNDNINEP